MGSAILTECFLSVAETVLVWIKIVIHRQTGKAGFQVKKKKERKTPTVAEQWPMWPSPFREWEGEEVSCLSTAPLLPGPLKKPQLKKEEKWLLMSHVKEMWAALFEYHKQRCCGKRRVWGQGFLAQSPLPFPCVLWSLSHLALTPTCTRQAATQSNSSHSQDIIHLLFSTQLSLEQHGFELCGSTYTRIFFSPINMYCGTTPREIGWVQQYKGQVIRSYADFPV